MSSNINKPKNPLSTLDREISVKIDITVKTTTGKTDMPNVTVKTDLNVKIYTKVRSDVTVKTIALSLIITKYVDIVDINFTKSILPCMTSR